MCKMHSLKPIIMTIMKTMITQLLRIQRAAEYDHKNLEFAICNVLADLLAPGVSPLDIFQRQTDPRKHPAFAPSGAKTEQKLRAIMKLQRRNAQLMWHRNLRKKLVCQCRLYFLERKKAGLSDIFSYCRTVWQRCNPDEPLDNFSQMLASVSKKKYGSVYQCGQIDMTELIRIRRDSCRRQDVFKMLKNLLAKQPKSAKNELRRWMENMPHNPAAGKTLYILVSRHVHLQDRLSYHYGLPLWLIQKDLKQREKLCFYVSDVMDWWCFYYEHRNWGEEEFAADVSALAEIL